MIMRFTKEEIEVIVRQHVLDQWNVDKDALGSVELTVAENCSKGGGHHVWIDVKVATNPEDGGGPYRTSGR
jgi:hypothetical protein